MTRQGIRATEPSARNTGDLAIQAHVSWRQQFEIASKFKATTLTQEHYPIFASSSLTELGLRREMKPGHVGPDYTEHVYDYDTFWYDAFWDRGNLVVFCPKLFGLYHLIREGQFYLDEDKVGKPRLKSHEFYDVLFIRASKKPQTLRFEWGGSSVESPVNSVQQDSAPHTGKNVAVTLSRDNDLTWIEDFARYHCQMHGLEKMLFFDNASTQYGLDDIREALRRGGIHNPTVLSAPFRYGVVSQDRKGKTRFNTMFLQTSLLNIARLRFLSGARAVLQCDIDELVWCKSGSIFDLTQKRPTGFVRLGVEWRYPAAGCTENFRHSDHIRKIADDKLCRAKYCIAPSGPLWFTSWHVHTIGLLKSRGSLITPKSNGIWHCKAITSSAWRSYDTNARSNYDIAPETQAALDHVNWSKNPAG
ncbi:hypothetical protein RUM4293_04583 [Ruegeria atlantica]|uniref:Uncharacterized protein n=1 Tax=Ruegeria atlantica TaxID=81569 RepID=A0A0P1ESS4_9RHOB|nr:hypothetical protein RUM4293_04583 [Ruegeria atlantica]